MVSQEEKNWSLFAHLGVLVGHVIPLGNILLPLVIYLTKGKESAFISENARESLNFQISISIYFLLAGILTLIVIGIVLMIAVWVFLIVMVIKASIKSYDGEKFVYPFKIDFVK